MKFACIALFAVVLSGCAQLSSQLGAYGLADGRTTLTPSAPNPTRFDPYPLDAGKDCIRTPSPLCSGGG
jgi:hypothetical protein